MTKFTLRKAGVIAALLLCLGGIASRGIFAQGPASISLASLSRFSPTELEAIYARSAPGVIPTGKVRGRALIKPGSKLAPILSQGGKLVWQGKVFESDGSSSINRFFGVKAVRANVSYGPSWRDGNPAIILDYGQTSRIYANYRDELREVAPGIFLGLMFDRTIAPPKLKMYFAVQAL